MKEKDFNPETMKIATPDDVERMWIRLWGASPLITILAKDNPGIEYLDLTQEILYANET